LLSKKGVCRLGNEIQESLLQIMIDNIFKGLIDWLAVNVPAALDTFTMFLLAGLSPDLTVMSAYFPFLQKTYTVFMWFALSLIVLMLIMNLLRVFAGPILDNVDMPFPVVARAMLFFFLTMNAQYFCQIAMNLAKLPYEAIKALSMTEAVEGTGAPQKLFDVFRMAIFDQANLGAVADLIAIIFVLAIYINFIKLLLEAVERYIVIGVLSYTSPLLFCFGSARSTAGIFRGWIRMYGSALFLLTLNVWFIRAFLSAMSIGIASGGVILTDENTLVGSQMLWMLALLAFLKIAQKADAMMATLGFSTTQTGSGLFLEAMAAGKMIGGAASGFSRAASHASKGSGGGHGGGPSESVKHGNGGMAPVGGDAAVSVTKNRSGTQMQSVMSSDDGMATTVSKVSLNSEQAPKGASYITHDDKNVPWATTAKGANAAAYIGPQFGENSRNTGFQTTKSPEKFGQLTGASVAEAFRESYTDALAEGNSPFRAMEMANESTQSFVSGSVAAEAVENGESPSYAAGLGAQAASGYQEYQDHALSTFGENLPYGAAIENDPDQIGHLSVYGTSEMGMPVEQDYYLASANSEPQGAYSSFSDKDGNAWNVVDHAQFDQEAISNPTYFSEAYLPNINQHTDSPIQSVDTSRASDGVFTASTDRGQYMVSDASVYQAPRSGSYETIHDTNNHPYYLTQGKEEVRNVVMRSKDNNAPIYDDAGSVQTTKTVGFRHAELGVAKTPKNRI